MTSTAKQLAVRRYLAKLDETGAKAIQVRLSPENHDKLKKLSERHDKSRTEIINWLIQRA